jgi:hypothetical protein
MGKVYCGIRTKGYQSGTLISVGTSMTDIHSLKHIVRHSPTGMEFGYGGSGPADLALSILTDVFGGRVELADLYYMDFKFELVAGWSSDEWVITSDEIDEWLKKKTGSGIEDLKQRYDALDEEGKLTLRYSRKL